MPDRLPRDGPLHLGQVLLLHAVSRVLQTVGQVSVVGQEQQSLGVPVQPAHGEDAGTGGQQAGQRPRGVRVS